MSSRCRFTILAIMAGVISLVSRAEIPEGYYNSAYNLTTSELKTAISEIVNPHQAVGYSALPTYFQQTDLYPNSTQWWDMYGSAPIYLPWNGQLLNREHSLPKSWWGGTETTPAYTDLNHLYPGEAVANQKKLNYPLGEVKTTEWTNGVSTIGVGVNSGGAKYVFEPDDEYKGDFARTYFYMVTSYQDLNWVTTWQVKNGTYPSLQQWSIDLLLKWHRADQVSEKELLRNEKVYSIQNNRNPFIDYPELAEYIWGNKMGEQWNPGSSAPTTNPVLSAPINNMYLDFGQVGLGKNVTKQMLIKGTDLSSSELRMVIGGTTDCGYFSVPGQTQTSAGATVVRIESSAAASASGTWVTIVYTPAAIGTHEAVGTITGGGLQGSVRFNLRGECLEAPSLSRPTNPRAEDITSTSYLAAWDIPQDETIDYWTVTRTIYKGNTTTTKEEIAESNELDVLDFADADYETFTVKSHRLGYESPESDVVVVNHSAINAIDADMPMAVEAFEGCIRIRCSIPLSGLTVYDMTGRTVMTTSQPVADGTEFTLSRGIYIVSSPDHRRPIKVIVK